MFLIDDFLIGGLGFVLDKLATVVDQELNDEQRLKQTLLEAQMQNELGEISDAEFKDIEAAVIGRLRELREAREAQQGTETLDMTDDGVRVTGVDISGPDDLER